MAGWHYATSGQTDTSNDDGGDAPVWDHMSLLGDPRFREAVQLRALAEAEVSVHYRRLLDIANRVLSEIEER